MKRKSFIIDDPILGDYRIVVDVHNYSLHIDGNPKGYYNTLDKLLKHLSRMKMIKKSKNYSSIKEYLKEHGKVYNEIKESIERIQTQKI